MYESLICNFAWNARMGGMNLYLYLSVIIYLRATGRANIIRVTSVEPRRFGKGHPDHLFRTERFGKGQPAHLLETERLGEGHPAHLLETERSGEGHPAHLIQTERLEEGHPAHLFQTERSGEILLDHSAGPSGELGGSSRRAVCAGLRPGNSSHRLDCSLDFLSGIRLFWEKQRKGGLDVPRYHH